MELIKHIFNKHKRKFFLVFILIVFIIVYVLHNSNAATGPTAADVKISGTPNVGKTLTGFYTYINNPWLPLSTPGFSAGYTQYNSFAIAKDGTKYVVYQDVTNSKKATVMKFNGTSWVPVGTPGFSIGESSYDSVAIAPDGTPYVAYQDGTDGDGLNNGKATVMKFNGTNWVPVGTPGFSTWPVIYTSIAVASDGSLYVSYNSDYGNEVLKFNGASWDNTGTPGFASGALSSISLSVSSDGTPYIAYQDYSVMNGKASVMKFNGVGWSPVGKLGFSDGTVNYLSFAIEPITKNLYVAYQDNANYDKATVMKFDGTSWSSVGTPGFSAGGAYYVSITTSSNGTPYVVYGDSTLGGYQAIVMKFNGTSWQTVGTPGFSDGQPYNASIKIDIDGTPYVAYGGNSGKETVARLTAPNPEGATSFQWYRDGVKIPSAIFKTYTLTSDDIGKSIRFGVTPVAQIGSIIGSEVQSESFLIVAPVPVVPSVVPKIKPVINPTPVPVVPTPPPVVVPVPPIVNTIPVVTPTPTPIPTQTPNAIPVPTPISNNIPTSTAPNTQIAVVSNMIVNNLGVILTSPTFNQIKGLINTPAAKTITLTITTIGAVTGLVVTLASAVSAPFTAPGFASVPLRLWTLALSALGIKKKEKKWGSVYDSVTMQPLDPAYVVLLNEKGEEVATSITDLDGRYGFPVAPGNYTIVANKTDYLFPSQKLLGKIEDILHSDLYFGGIISVKEAGEVITKNIPMDSVKFNWNEFAKGQQNVMHFYKKSSKIVARISNILFDLGLITALLALIFAPVYWNIGIFSFYVLLLILRHTKGFKTKKTGSIVSKEGKPLAFAIIRVFSAGMPDTEIIHRVTDQFGNFYCLLPNGNYIVKIEEKTGELTYATTQASEPIKVTKGIIDNKFII